MPGQQFLRDRVSSRHQILEVRPDHELGNDPLNIVGRKLGKTLGRVRNIIRKRRQYSLDLTAIPRFDGGCDVEHVTRLDIGTPKPDLLGDDFRDGLQMDFLSENFSCPGAVVCDVTRHNEVDLADGVEGDS